MLTELMSFNNSARQAYPQRRSTFTVSTLGSMESIVETTLTKAHQAFEACWSQKWLSLLLVMAFSICLRDYEATSKGVKAPIAGRWPFEPYFMTGLRFKCWSMLHLSDGYRKVRPRASC